MKKFLLILICLTSFTGAVYAEQGSVQKTELKYYNIPTWDEFCAPDYIISEYIKPTFWNQLFYGSKMNVKYNNYWVARHNTFDTQLKHCEFDVADQYKQQCYQDVRQAEINKNNVFMAEVNQDQQARNTELKHMEKEMYMQNQYDLNKKYIDSLSAPKTYNLNLNHN